MGEELLTDAANFGTALQPCLVVGQLLAMKTRPTVLVDDNARIVAANPAARELLASKKAWIAGRCGELRLSNPVHTAELHEKIRLLSSKPVATRMVQHMTAAEGASEMIILAKLDSKDCHTVAQSSTCQHCVPSVAIALAENIGAADVSAQLIASAFDLTPMEARLAVALIDGQTLREFSDTAGVKISTVRWHLRNALRKTNCAGQRDFVRKALLTLMSF